MIVTQTPESIVHDVLDDRPETAHLSWGDKTDIASAVVHRLIARGDCLHSEECSCD